MGLQKKEKIFCAGQKFFCTKNFNILIFFTVCSIKNMPLLGNFSDTYCVHCCYKNIVPPHFHNVVLTYIHSSSIFAPHPCIFSQFFCVLKFESMFTSLPFEV